MNDAARGAHGTYEARGGEGDGALYEEERDERDERDNLYARWKKWKEMR